MSEDRIKSAWEIALEKADRLGKLSPEEAKKRLEEEFYPRGKALAERYLKGLPQRDLEMELNRFANEKEKDMVKRGFFTTLVAKIALEEIEKSGRALDGILFVSSDPSLLTTRENIIALLNKYHEAKDSLYSSSQQTITGKAEEQLKQLGIAGSSIQVNMLATGEWQEAQEKLHNQYGDELTPLKKSLLASFGAHPDSKPGKYL